ncbi:MAG: hypothetical protein OZSIB_1551 [Candidatus Ozemobacter sibiricus]|uniref:Calcineurin-like phosphoesterase domain-containing protein n=1 Tax=Candidatus Ozemobacter sibiricus TaxID=2268124 RepID=A0A367ZKL6_9BACT|nr:MAG: hypothetical protein OZSIB_1551 [Candidatus Ozemobacter sibiricus]
MKILYATDLHARPDRYREVLDHARWHRVDAVVTGGDALEWCLDDLAATAACQQAFLRDFLDPHFREYDDAGIHWLGILSSHDLPAIDEAFDALCAAHTHAHHCSRRRIELGGYEFIGFDLVVDYPFPPKSRCRAEDARFRPPPGRGQPVEATPEGWRVVPDWPARLASLPTIEQELAALPRPRDPRRAVYIIHHPPAGLGLATIHSGADIGSPVIRRFLEQLQPRVALHGHIHESPAITGRWQGWLGSTLCLQPGQGDPLQWLLLDLDTLEATWHGPGGPRRLATQR